MNLKTVLKHFDLDEIIGLDYETYWASDYSLSNMATTEYIIDPRFKMHCVSIRADSAKTAMVANEPDFKRWAKSVNWDRTGMLAHHTHFDGLIASHHYGIKPARYFDTLSMARPLMPVTVGGSLKAVCAAFNRKAKLRAGALVDTKGKRDLTTKEYAELAKYAGDDIDDCWFLFGKLLPYMTLDELELIDLTIKMYAQPQLLVNGTETQAVQANALGKKGAYLDKLKVYCGDLMSNDRFAALLEKAGLVDPRSEKAWKKYGQPTVSNYDAPALPHEGPVVIYRAGVTFKELKHKGIDTIPLKLSKKTGDLAYAFAKTDLPFKDLLRHPRKRVRDLTEARLAMKSTGLETRAERLTTRSSMGAQPIYLTYWGAKTGRWSGGDKANWQNLVSKRKEGGAELRAAIHAPKGKSLLIADLGQIEARLNAWHNGQKDIVEAFRRGEDVYKLEAAGVYRKAVEVITAAQRFVGKTCTLGLGYQAGAKRFADMLRTGALGPPVDISDAEAEAIVAAWRAKNNYIVAGWRRAENFAKSAFLGKQKIQDGVLTYEGVGNNGFIHLPGGMAIRYDRLQMTEEGMSYTNKYRNKKDGTASEEIVHLYGGILVENYIQALGRRIIAEHILTLTHRLPDSRIAMTTHDEVVFVVPTKYSDKALATANEVMSTSPEWAPDLPLAVEAHISEKYDK